MCFPGGSVVNNLPVDAGDVGSIPGLERSLGGGNGNPLQYLVWEIKWKKEPGQWGHKKSGTTEHACTHQMYIEFIPIL